MELPMPSSSVEESPKQIELTNAKEIRALSLSFYKNSTARLDEKLNAAKEAKIVLDYAIEEVESARKNQKRYADELKEADRNVKKAFRVLVEEKGGYTVVEPGTLSQGGQAVKIRNAYCPIGPSFISSYSPPQSLYHTPGHTPPQSPVKNAEDVKKSRSEAFHALVKEKGGITVVRLGDFNDMGFSDREIRDALGAGSPSHTPDHSPPQSPKTSPRSRCYSPWDPDHE